MCEHNRWVKPSEIQTPGCGYTDGDNAVQEIVVAVLAHPSPKAGYICLDCYQVFGQPDGVRDQRLLRLEEMLKDFQQT